MPLPQRKSPRLQGYDYSQSGAYFVTICVQKMQQVFGDIVDGDMQYNSWGQVAHDCWVQIPDHYSSVELDAFVIMPNHVHGILLLTPLEPPLTQKRVTLGRIIGAYKAAVTRTIQPLSKLWQERYHDHIIRNTQDLSRIREYVVNNPLKWETDTYYSENL